MNQRVWTISLGLVMGLLLVIGFWNAVSAEVLGETSPIIGWGEAGEVHRSGDGMAFIVGGDLYYAGGWTGDPTQPSADVQGFDHEAVTWGFAPPLEPGRFGSAVATHNDYAYLLGGYGGGYLPTVSKFNGSNWHSEANLPDGGGAFFAATTLSMGDKIYLYIAGGLPGPTSEVRRAEIVEDGTLVWNDGVESNSLKEKLSGLGLVSYQNCLFAVGGKDASGQPHAEIYAAPVGNGGQVGAWNQVDYINRSQSNPLAFSGVVIHHNKLYILGGEMPGNGYSNQGFSVTVNADCTLGNDWQTFDMPGDSAEGLRRMAVAARWGEIYGELYVMGGQTATGYSAAAWRTTLPTPDPELTLRKSAQVQDGEFDYGQLITYTLAYHNPWEHPEGHTGVFITDTVPVSTTFVSASSGITPTEEGMLRWDNIGDLAPDAGGEVTFTVQVDTPAFNWVLSGGVTITGEITNVQDGSLVLGPDVESVFTYDGQAREGVIIAATVPTQIFPITVTGTAEDIMDYAYRAAQSQVLVRVPGPITQSGSVTITYCISETFVPEAMSPISVVLSDAAYQTQTAEISFAQEGFTVPVTCSPPSTALINPHPNDVLPLDPEIIIRNLAWICSDQLENCQVSNETITRHWPHQIYLPLVLRDSN